MSAGIEIEGLDALYERLSEMGRKGGVIANAALREAAEPIAEEARRRAPKISGTLRDEIKVLNVSTKQGVKGIKVGIKNTQNGPAFYSRFLEFGSSHQNAKPFLRPAFWAKRDEAKKIIIERTKEGLGLK